MKNFIRIALLIIVSAVASHAKLFQTIRLNIQNSESVKVEGELVTVDSVTEAVLRHVRGKDAIEITIIVPLALDRAVLKKIMDNCRKAGAEYFTLISKA